MSVDDVIRKTTSNSDIPIGSDAYREIAQGLVDTGLNLAFFVFQSRERSSCARTLYGKTSSQPALTLYLKYTADFQETGIDHHNGNWNDQWKLTHAVREIINSNLKCHGFGNDWVSDHTFVFVRTLEEIAFWEIGRECKDIVHAFISNEVPGVVVSHIYWNGGRYDVIMQNKADYKEIKRDVKERIKKALPGLLSNADKEGYCQSYSATIEFGYIGMNLFHLIREDISAPNAF